MQSIQIDGTFPELHPGSVWLVGAGPGDPGLLNLHALAALRQADVILYDALVSPEVLVLAREGAELEATGKRARQPSISQREIGERIVHHASRGRRVVRLKGGDPFVFGRGAEEASELLQQGIPVSVVPGITAGIAGLSAAAVALTSRETNSAVTFATGHFADQQPDRIDWAALAKVRQPIVIYMGVGSLGDILAKLSAGGMDPDTPVIVVSRATLADQSTVRSRLSCIVRDLKDSGLQAPAIVAIGANVSTQDVLAKALVPLRPAGGVAARYACR